GQRARGHALDAAARATLGLERTANLSTSVIVGQVRSTATDLVKALGASDEEAVEAVRAAVRELARQELHDGA
ncbi:MAG: rane protein-like protein, partial [Solirubrobacterales bacterium]|nr:rane protein-like protein [Solirubrobacterales bacterium]